jgi:hypothetical protein
MPFAFPSESVFTFAGILKIKQFLSFCSKGTGLNSPHRWYKLLTIISIAGIQICIKLLYCNINTDSVRNLVSPDERMGVPDWPTEFKCRASPLKTV